MGADVRRSDATPRVFRRRNDDQIDGDRNRRVFGLGRNVGEGDRDRMRSWVAPLEPCRVVGLPGAGMVSAIRGVVPGRDVRVRRRAVVMVRVIVVRVRVHMMQRRRRGRRQHRDGHDGGNGSKHHAECMRSGHVRQTVLRVVSTRGVLRVEHGLDVPQVYI